MEIIIIRASVEIMLPAQLADNDKHAVYKLVIIR